MINKTHESKPHQLKKLHALLIVCALLCLILASCSSKDGANAGDPLSKFQVSDMGGYNGLSGYDKETVFVDVTMDDVDQLMKSGASFVLYAGFDNCPWCNVLIPYLNDAALEAGAKIAYVDTRRDPSWQSNLDLEGYDIFVEYFGEYLDMDTEGKPHLYVPDVYFIKDGQVVDRHEGVTPGLDSPSDALTEDMKKDLMAVLKEGFDSCK